MIETVCVCGAGTMGSGIALLIASHGFRTTVYDVDPSVTGKSLFYITEQLEKLVEKKKITEQDKSLALAHLLFTTNVNDCIADLVIEAIIENLPAKIALFNQLAEINHAETIFTSNTSSLSVSMLARSVQHPERVAGLHFFNPAPVMKLVEVVTTDFVVPQIIETLIGFVSAIGKTAVNCKDSPGFIVNRVARPYYLESLFMAETLKIPIGDIDLLLKSRGFPMGPFKLMDLIGNDINYAVTCSVYEALKRPARLAPSPMQEQKVNDRELGIKTGRGYYDYPGSPGGNS